MKKTKQNKKIFLAGAVFLLVFGLITFIKIQAGKQYSGRGWFWGGSNDGWTPISNNTGLGWISLNDLGCDKDGNGFTDTTNECGGDNASTPVVPYGVNIPAKTDCAGTEPECQLNGYAWIGNGQLGATAGSNVGWLSFNSADIQGCPDNLCFARRVNNELQGWARFVWIKDERVLYGNTDWDGWVKLSGDSTKSNTCVTGPKIGQACTADIDCEERQNCLAAVLPQVNPTCPLNGGSVCAGIPPSCSVTHACQLGKPNFSYGVTVQNDNEHFCDPSNSRTTDGKCYAWSNEFGWIDFSQASFLVEPSLKICNGSCSTGSAVALGGTETAYKGIDTKKYRACYSKSNCGSITDPTEDVTEVADWIDTPISPSQNDTVTSVSKGEYRADNLGTEKIDVVYDPGIGNQTFNFNINVIELGNVTCWRCNAGSCSSLQKTVCDSNAKEYSTQASCQSVCRRDSNWKEVAP